MLLFLTLMQVTTWRVCLTIFWCPGKSSAAAAVAAAAQAQRVELMRQLAVAG
jgi:hypothetical protein